MEILSYISFIVIGSGLILFAFRVLMKYTDRTIDVASLPPDSISEVDPQFPPWTETPSPYLIDRTKVAADAWPQSKLLGRVSDDDTEIVPPPLPRDDTDAEKKFFSGMPYEDRSVLLEVYECCGEVDIPLIQRQHDIWRKYNFPTSRPWHPMAGINEEIGEAALVLIKIAEAAGRLNHGVLKQSQDIRTNEDHQAELKDAIGDIFIYSVDFCNRHGIDMCDAVVDAWDEVRKRDWRSNNVDGS